MAYEFTGKKVAVIGIARSGMAAADVLTRRGAIVTLYDGKQAAELSSQIDWANANGIEAVTSAQTVGDVDIAVVSPGVHIHSPMMSSIRSRGIELWGEIEAAYRIAAAPILAVTGTNGKTTTVLMLADMLRRGGVNAYAAGNIAAGALAQPLIAAADIAGPDEAIVAEISSFQLETTVTFRPKVAALLNITPDHQDRQIWDEYVASKWRIFQNQGAGDTAVLSRTVPLSSPVPHLPENVRYFDKAFEPDWLANLSIPGAHNRLNALAASEMAAAFGIDERSISAAAVVFKGVVHRLEFVANIDGVVYINNSMCTNNAAFGSSLDALPGSKIVIAGGVFKGGDMTPIADAVQRSEIKQLITFGRSGPEIAEIVKKKTAVPTKNVDDLPAAVAFAAQRAAPGDSVVLNPGCASFDQFKDFEDRGDNFKILVDSLRKATCR